MKHVLICTMGLILIACSKENIKPNHDSLPVENKINEETTDSNLDMLFEELDREIETAIANGSSRSNGILDAEHDANEWDFAGVAYAESLSEANRINSGLSGEVNDESLSAYFDIVSTNWLRLIPDQEQFRIENNINNFESQIHDRYHETMARLKSRNSRVVVSKVFERFVIRNVVDVQRKQRLLVGMSISRHTYSLFYEEGMIVNGSQILTDEDGSDMVSGDFINAMIDCVQGYYDGFDTWAQEYACYLFPVDCQNIAIAACYLELS